MRKRRHGTGGMDSSASHHSPFLSGTMRDTAALLETPGLAKCLLEKKGVDKPGSQIIPASATNELIRLGKKFESTRSIRDHELSGIMGDVEKIYSSFTQTQRVAFFADLYDRFSDTYDQHMGVETRHYQAIHSVLGFAARFIKFPIIDLSAGTGEPMKYALEFVEMAEYLTRIHNRNIGNAGSNSNRYAPFKDHSEALRAANLFRHELSTLPRHEKTVQSFDSERHIVCVNEISTKMLAKAVKKLDGIAGVSFTNFSAYAIPKEFHGKFNSVLCSQTFHIISEEDKTEMVRSMYKVLAPGGVAIVMEDDPWLLTPTSEISAVSLYLRSVAKPIPKRGDLIGLFKSNGFIKLETRAAEDIDPYHIMRVYLFEKP